MNRAAWTVTQAATALTALALGRPGRPLDRAGCACLGTLFGVVELVHPAGSFVGIWFGGWAAESA